MADPVDFALVHSTILAFKTLPPTVNTLNNIAFLYKKVGDFQNALLFFDQAITMSDVTAVIYFNRGNLLVAMKNYDLAIESFEKSIELDNDFHDPHASLGWLLHAQGFYEEAVEHYNEAYHLSSTDAERSNIEENIGILYHEMYILESNDKAKPLAVKHYEAALKLDPERFLATEFIVLLREGKSETFLEKRGVLFSDFQST